jgi:MFS family permease
MRSRSSLAGVFVGCFLASVGANAYMLAPASIVPLLVDAFGVSEAGAGLAISATILGSVVVQLPGGFLMDRYDNRRLLTAGVVLFAGAAIAGTAPSTYALFLAGRAVAGLAAGGLFVLGTNVVSRVFAGRRQGFVTTLFVASAPVGFAVSQVAGPALATAYGWTAPFVAYPLIAVVGYLLFRLARPAPIRTGDPITVAEFGTALRNRAVLLVSFAGFCSYMVYIFLNSWMPTYATDTLPLTLQQAGAVTALLPAVGIVARPTGGWLSDRLGYRRRLIVVLSLGGALPAFLIISRAFSAAMFAAVMLAVGFLLQFGMGVYYVYTNELAVAGSGGTSLAVFTTVAFTGTLISPTLGGWLIRTVAWQGAFAVYVVIGLLGTGAVFLTRDSAPGGHG